MQRKKISLNKTISIVSVIVCMYGVTAFAQGYSFSKDLTVGATGSDVAALQTWLMENGFHITDIESRDAAKGRFGAQTREAVRLYQKSAGLPKTGFFGPLTRASINKTEIAVTASPASSVATNNSTSTPVIATQKTIMTPGIAGALALSLWPAPGDSTPVAKGQTVDVAAFKAQSSASDMALESVSIDFNTRFWLYASAISLKDDQGNIVGQVSNLNQNSFSELTVGSDYRVTIPVSSYVLPHGTSRILTVNISALPSSDRNAGAVSITQFQTRAVDGTGVTDTQTLSATRSFQYQGSGAGTVILTVDPKSPPNMLAPISRTAMTKNVPLGVIDFTSQGQNGTMRSITLFVNTSRDRTTNISALFNNVKLQSGNQIYPAKNIFYTTQGTEVEFTDMNIALPENQPVPVAILVDVNPDTSGALNGSVASSSMLASGTSGGASNNPVVEDPSFTAIAVTATPLLSSDITFSESDANLYSASPSATLGSPVMRNSTTAGYNVSFSFPVTAGNDTLYISADPNVALATTSTGFSSNSSALLPISGAIASPGTLGGDSNTSSLSGYYIIPAGMTRTFTYNGSISNVTGVSGFKTFSITGVNYGTSTSALSANTIVYYNYAQLKIATTF